MMRSIELQAGALVFRKLLCQAAGIRLEEPRAGALVFLRALCQALGIRELMEEV